MKSNHSDTSKQILGALLYCPANDPTIAQRIIENKIPSPYSLALCLEDTIAEDYLEQATELLVHTLQLLDTYQKTASNLEFFPKIFIRVRNPQQISFLSQQDMRAVITGIIAPKICPQSLPDYIKAIQNTQTQWLFMPILENPILFDLRYRIDSLYQLKEQLEEIKEFVPAVRVGGSDLCHHFSIRRDMGTTIFEIPVISHLLSDILTVFSPDYPVSGTVFEYYQGENWEECFLKEVQQDRTNGFLGKTVIHPNQIPLLNQVYRVSQRDYKDAQEILNWNPTANKLVSGCSQKERMNERNTHSNWAKKILLLEEQFGREL